MAIEYEHDYKIGDKVILTSKFPAGWGPQMRKFLGRTVVINGIHDFRFSFIGDENWFYRISNIKRKVVEVPVIKVW